MGDTGGVGYCRGPPESAGDIRFGEGHEVELKGLAGLNRVYTAERPEK